MTLDPDRCGNEETATVLAKIDKEDPDEVVCYDILLRIDVIEQAGGTRKQTDFQYEGYDSCDADLKLDVKV